MENTSIPELLTDSLIHELPNLFPDIRVPVSANAEYYIEQLRRSVQYAEMDSRIHLVTDMLDKHGEVTEFGLRVTQYKRRIVGKFQAMWKEKGFESALDNMPSNRAGLETREASFENGFYLSLDIVSANFSVCNHFLDLGTPNWGQFCAKNMPDMHWGLVTSKSFRQNLFGNTNPKRIQNLTASLTKEFVSSLENNHPAIHSRIVGISHDEIVLRADSMTDLHTLSEYVDSLVWYPRVPIKATPFVVERLENEGKGARLENVFFFIGSKPHLFFKRLRGVPGNRYHLLFKKHVLGEKPEYRDMIFLMDGKQAQWQE